MAKPQRKRNAGTASAGSATAVAEEDRPMSDAIRATGGEGRVPAKASGPAGTPTTEPRRSFFDVYKSGQGYYTRMVSGLGFGVMLAWFAWFLFDQLSVLEADTGRYIQVGVPVAVLLGFGMLGYYILALNRKACDFLIATEGEMKKVNWTSRKEIIGSTKVVIFVLVVMSVLLFVVDLFFMFFFNRIGVLKGELPF